MQQPFFMQGGMPLSPTMQPMQPMPMQMMSGGQMMPMQPYPGQVMTMMPGGMMMPAGEQAPPPQKVQDVEGGDAVGEVLPECALALASRLRLACSCSCSRAACKP